MIGDGMIYSPSSCVYLPRELNNVLMMKRPSDSVHDLPLGISFAGKSYSVNGIKKCFRDINEAKSAYLSYKKGTISTVGENLFNSGKISEEVYTILLKVIDSLNYSQDCSRLIKEKPYD